MSAASNRERDRVLVTLNAGSSSLKFAVFSVPVPADGTRELSGAVEGIGTPGAALRWHAADGTSDRHPVDVATHDVAAAVVIRLLADRSIIDRVAVIGHRVVHGGPDYMRAAVITDAMLDALRAIQTWDEDHLPQQLAIIAALRRHCPGRPDVACFDTAFHASMPPVAQRLPVPQRLLAGGVRRYGFHGLSFTYLLDALERAAGSSAARGRVILAHLGAGASLVAVRNGAAVDTTMGFTPTSGIMMATRPGDLDPGLIAHLLRTGRLDVAGLSTMINRQSGLLGVSGSTGDMRRLLQLEGTEPPAAEAVELFCYQGRKAVGALAAVLGGVDTLVLSGGIGEHAATIRARLVDRLEHLGIAVDAARNATNQAIISPDGAACTVRVIPTDEEIVIARQTQAVVAERGEGRTAAR
jgi:acetate kinase